MRLKGCIVSEYIEHQVKENKDLKFSVRKAANSENVCLYELMCLMCLHLITIGCCYGLHFIESDVIGPRFLIFFVKTGWPQTLCVAKNDLLVHLASSPLNWNYRHVP